MGTGSDDGARTNLRNAAANDNAGARAGKGGGPEARAEAAVMRPARLLGRQIAREHFAAGCAANDNAPEPEAREQQERQEVRDHDPAHGAPCPLRPELFERPKRQVQA